MQTPTLVWPQEVLILPGAEDRAGSEMPCFNGAGDWGWLLAPSSPGRQVPFEGLRFPTGFNFCFLLEWRFWEEV